MVNFRFLETLRDNKIRAAKDHGKKFQCQPASSFCIVVHSNLLQPETALDSLSYSAILPQA